MPDLNQFLSTISEKDWSSCKIPVTSKNENSEAMPWILGSSANVTCEILKEYTKWLMDNYNIQPKN